MAEEYEIRIKGHINASWAQYFDGLQLAHHADGTTHLTGPVTDQPALLGLLNRIGSLGLPILIVRNTNYNAQNVNIQDT